MDLRIVKTKKAIREAFLQVRKTTPLEKMKVRDLCRIALINKSTFYNHYEDVFALSEEMENEILEQCMNGFEYKDCLITDPMKFLCNVPKALEKQNDIISVLFSNRQDVLFTKLQCILLKCYRKPGMSVEEDVQLTFIIGGTMYAMQELLAEGNYTENEITECTVKVIEKL